MKTMNHFLKITAAMMLALALFTGCESTGGSVSGSVYYGTGFYDPWYYGDYYHQGDIIVTPPARPERPAHPEQPIYHPSTPRPTPMPSIPSAPRISPRGGGGRR